MEDKVMGILYCPRCAKKTKIRKKKARYDYNTGELKGHDLEIVCSNGFFKCSNRRAGCAWSGWVGIHKQSSLGRWI